MWKGERKAAFTVVPRKKDTDAMIPKKKGGFCFSQQKISHMLNLLQEFWIIFNHKYLNCCNQYEMMTKLLKVIIDG